MFPCQPQQAHEQLVCTVPLARTTGTVVVTTAAGTGSTDFDVSTLLLPPTITSVTPFAWSTSVSTQLVVMGDRCVTT